MRNLLFASVSITARWALWAVNSASDLIQNVIDLFFRGLAIVIAFTSKSLLMVIDKARVDHIAQYIEQISIHSELDILMAVTRVKEDALNQQKWTPDHSNALNILGSKLLSECNWDERRIHQYMRGVVESIPGLVYSGGIEEDEDDDNIYLDE